MNKIDDFFKNRLDVNSSDDDWNMPSEDMWNAAKSQFPKKKKRSSLWLWFLIGLVLSGTVLWYNNHNTTSVFCKDGDKHVQVSSKDSFTTDNEVGGEDIFVAHKSLMEGELSNELRNGKSEIGINEIDLKQSKIKHSSVKEAAKVLDFAEYGESKSSDYSTRVELSGSEVDQYQKNEKLILNTGPSNMYQDEDVSERTTGIIKELAESDIVGVNTVAVSKLEEDTSLEQVDDFISIVELNNTLAETVSMNESDLVMEKKYPFIQPKVVVRPREEVGVSSQLFLLSLFNGEDLDDSPEGSVVFEGQYKNVNLKYLKWIGRKWSIATGLHLADLAVNLNFDTEIEYNEDDFGKIIDSQYGEAISRNYDPNSTKTVNLKPGVELANGDLLRLNGEVDLGLKAIQIPIILNYHWYNKRVEFYTGVGITLEAIWVTEKNGDFELFDHGTLISEPVNQQDVSESYVDLSLYTKLGSKINLTRQFNLDLNLSLLVTDPIFSGVEIGLHYRWYK